MVFTIALIAHLPILVQYSARMWRTGHYQFFPLMIAAVVWIFLDRKSYIFGEKQTTNRWLKALALSLNFLLVTVAAILNSSFLGAISCWILAASYLYCSGGISGLKRGAPLLAALIFIIPLPARIDEKLILNLQFVASQCASRILDNLGIVHFVEGVILVTDQEQFMIEEACSGVRSLFSSLAGITLYTAIQRMTWWRYPVNLIQTVAWVLVGNAIRVALVVYFTDRWTDAIATGIGHDLLGIAMFLFVLAMSISTDRLINALAPAEETGEEFRPDTTVEESKLDEQHAPSVDIKNSEINVSKLNWANTCFSILFVCVALVGCRLLWLQSQSNGGLWITDLPRIKFPKQDYLPEVVGDWKRTEFEWRQRGRENLQAEDSFVWTYESADGITATFSLDCPWDKWHNLADCYSGLGWETNLTFQNDPTIPWGFAKLDLQKLSGENGLVLFRSVDRNGAEVSPQFSGGFFSSESVAAQIWDNFSTLAGLDARQNAELNGIALPVTTFQLLCTSETDLSDQATVRLEKLFAELTDKISQSARFNSK